MNQEPAYILISTRDARSGWQILSMNSEHRIIETLSIAFSPCEAIESGQDESIRLGVPLLSDSLRLHHFTN